MKRKGICLDPLGFAVLAVVVICTAGPLCVGKGGVSKSVRENNAQKLAAQKNISVEEATAQLEDLYGPTRN